MESSGLEGRAQSLGCYKEGPQPKTLDTRTLAQLGPSQLQ